MLHVSKPILPDLNKLHELLQGVWSSGMLTNGGRLHQQLEAELKEFLDVPYARLFSSGTTALMCAIQALKLPQGAEIITTPLTFAATAHAITASGYKPVFADVDEATMTLDPKSVERALTDRTAAIIGVHVYGTICDTSALDHLCKKHNLYLVYDSAHAFGAIKNGVPVGTMGDMSVFSLHATKLFHTAEGGLVTTKDEKLARRLELARNFGIVDEDHVSDVGINGKMSEIHAAVGILNLPLVNEEREKRRQLRHKYNTILSDLPGLRTPFDQPDLEHSEQYYPVVVDADVFGVSRDDICARLKLQGISARRYFWPICTDFTPYSDCQTHSTHTVPVVDRLKYNVMCLPFHSGVEDHHIDLIAKIFGEKSASVPSSNKG